MNLIEKLREISKHLESKNKNVEFTLNFRLGNTDSDDYFWLKISEYLEMGENCLYAQKSFSIENLIKNAEEDFLGKEKVIKKEISISGRKYKLIEE